MDDEVFKKEVLSRLDKIVGLLSVSCALSSGSLDQQKADAALKQLLGGKKAESAESMQYRIVEEMQDDYAEAMRRWKQKKNL
jgi:cytochrome c-type biogenesis protein CcmH/NrfG